MLTGLLFFTGKYCPEVVAIADIPVSQVFTPMGISFALRVKLETNKDYSVDTKFTNATVSMNNNLYITDVIFIFKGFRFTLNAVA
ncbi:hypothetical protein [Serratia fonticola]|uniref:hypothetical protein n=1 Tax=Serratia fonticola TaxID=47917 RepID=UPI002DBE0CA4|nr:hypothetical protein [Serratia fonticola]MEB7884018.1 hypothetical protein [Serratia fonticola]